MTPRMEATVYPTPELVTLLLLERDRELERRRLARFAARVRACCSPSLLTRVSRALRAQPVVC